MKNEEEGERGKESRLGREKKIKIKTARGRDRMVMKRLVEREGAE